MCQFGSSLNLLIIFYFFYKRMSFIDVLFKHFKINYSFKKFIFFLLKKIHIFPLKKSKYFDFQYIEQTHFHRYLSLMVFKNSALMTLVNILVKNLLSLIISFSCVPTNFRLCNLNDVKTCYHISNYLIQHSFGRWKKNTLLITILAKLVTIFWRVKTRE